MKATSWPKRPNQQAAVSVHLIGSKQVHFPPSRQKHVTRLLKLKIYIEAALRLWSSVDAKRICRVFKWKICCMELAWEFCILGQETQNYINQRISLIGAQNVGVLPQRQLILLLLLSSPILSIHNTPSSHPLL